MHAVKLIFPTTLLLSVLVLGQQVFAEDSTTSREQANAYFAMHEGRWSGKVQSTIGEAEINKVDEEALNYLDFDYVKNNGLLMMRNYSPRGGGRGFSHYDSINKLDRRFEFLRGSIRKDLPRRSRPILARSGNLVVRHDTANAMIN